MPRFKPDSKKDAEKWAKELLKKIKLPGFKINVWKNLGWHYSVKSAYFDVDERHRGSTSEVYYIAMMNDRGDSNGSHASGHFTTMPAKAADPNEAIEKCIKDAYKVHMETGDLLQKIVDSVGLEVRYMVETRWEAREPSGIAHATEVKS